MVYFGQLLLIMRCGAEKLKHFACDGVLWASFGETDATVNKKAKKAMEYDLVPVICCGETLDQRKQDIHFDLVKNQITAAFEGIDGNEALDVVVAYEPIWAIGTGKTATPEQAQEVHEFIRSNIVSWNEAGQNTRILYGGSVNAGNAEQLFAQPDIDGGLIGGASLKVDDFRKICQAAG
mgnify:CR=1 FL=1